MSLLDNVLKSIHTIVNNNELEKLRCICEKLDDELDVLTTKIYKIRKVALEYSDELTITGDQGEAGTIKNLTDEVLEIIGNSPRCSNQQPN